MDMGANFVLESNGSIHIDSSSLKNLSADYSLVKTMRASILTLGPMLAKYKKAKILLKISNKFKTAGRKSKARSYANKALGFQPSMGRAYLLIANMYAESANDCGDDAFNKSAVNQ